ncbi:MAG: urea transporter [Bacteroidetes bacterium]|nr:urea transporter [Bacteroidota bacterium]
MITEKIKKAFPHFLDSILNSYSQIFFSNNQLFAIILVAVSFIDLVAGISGLLAVLISNGAAYLIGFSRFNIKSGYYGFNSLLVGLGLGIYYNLSVEFLLILIFSSMLTLFITVMLEGVVGKYGLPYLSISFLLGIWMVTLASRHFTALDISERGIFVANEVYAIGGPLFLQSYEWFNNLMIPPVLAVYFKSLGAIFFQYHILAGILIAIGLLIYSRLAFLLSLLGFFSAYFFYQIVGGNITELSYSYIGFNFILTAIAIGGFYIIPSRFSFLWVILLIPILSITITSSITLLNLFQLSIFSLPFNFVVLLFLYILKFRERFYHKPEIVAYQQFSPEKNLYSQINNKERFHNFKYARVGLPFWGEWTVTQAHHGEYTHKEDWAHAWDFEITNDDGATYKNSGRNLEDFYCYNKPVISPVDGVIEEVIDHIEDNDVGDMNLEYNWGNTVIVKHSEKLYMKLCHLKPGSFKVSKGDSVRRGDILAYCGNSGRSPEPHLHFQIQSTPFIGSKTLNHPISHYILHRETEFEFKSYAKPQKGDIISNIEKNNSLYKAFHFIPGQELQFKVKDDRGAVHTETWQVHTDIYNHSFLKDEATGSVASFKNEGNIHYFTHFEGDRKSLLFKFYLGAYKVPGGFYKGLQVNDAYPIHLLHRKLWIFFQDFIAPFYLFIRSEYKMEFTKLTDHLTDSNIRFISSAIVKHGQKAGREIDFEFEIESNRIKKFVVVDGNKTTEASEISTEKDG